VFRVGKAIFTYVSLRSSVILLVYFPLYVKTAHLVFSALWISVILFVLVGMFCV
jgi:hypothetical protein